MEWINKQLNVPFHGQVVLAIDKYENMHVVKYNSGEHKWMQEIEIFSDEEDIKITHEIRNITHWAELPETPISSMKK